MVALPASHALAAHDRLDLADLAGLPLRLTSRGENAVLFDTVVSACRAAGFDPAFGPPSTGLQDTLAEIGAGASGWTLVYPMAAHTVTSRRISLLPLVGNPVTIRMSLALRENAEQERLDLLTEMSARMRRTMLTL